MSKVQSHQMEISLMQTILFPNRLNQVKILYLITISVKATTCLSCTNYNRIQYEIKQKKLRKLETNYCEYIE